MFDIRLAVYDVNTLVDILPTPLEWAWGDPLNDSSALTFKYSKKAVNGTLADGLVSNEYDISFQVNWGAGWVEPRGGRLIVLDDSVDLLDQTEVRTFTCVSVDWDLGGVLNLSTSKSIINPDTQARTFTSATIGKVLKTMLDEGHTAGLASALTYDFTNSTDSSGTAWGSSFSKFGVPAANSSEQVLRSFTDMGFCDWTTEGNTLRVFKPDTTLKRNMQSVELMFGRELQDGPQRRSRRDYISNAIAIGDNGKLYAASKPVVGRRGRRAAVAQAGGIDDSGDATLAMEGLFAQSGRLIREQLTRTLILRGTGQEVLPFRDYLVGDLVLAPDSAGAMAPMRIRQITISGNAKDGVTGSVVINDRFLESQVSAARKFAALTGSGKLSTGNPPSRPESGKRKPAKVTGPSADSYAYISSVGSAVGLATLAWSPTTADVDGVSIGVGGYEVRARRV